MFRVFCKNYISALVVLLSMNTINSSLIADECCYPCECNRIYVGAFGGGIFSNSTKLTQMGTAFFTEASGGPLAVYATGRSKKHSAGFGGVQVGYEWSQCPIHFGCSDWTLAPAIEAEAYFYGDKKNGSLLNSTDRLPEHDFVDSFHLNMSVCLVNAVFSLNNNCFCRFSPYIGGGMGAAHISLNKAKSFQISPEEPGINHFNSKRSDTSWAFAGQLKAGVRYNVCNSIHLFAEYRYLFVDASNYILGSTVDPDHVPTSPWNVKVKSINYNAFSIGFQYDL